MNVLTNSLIVNAHDTSENGLSLLHYFLYGGSCIIMLIGLIAALTNVAKGMTTSDGWFMFKVGIGCVIFSYLVLRYLDIHLQVQFTPNAIYEIENGKVTKTITKDEIQYICGLKITTNPNYPIMELIPIGAPVENNSMVFHKVIIDANTLVDGHHPKPKLKDQQSIKLQYSKEVVDYLKVFYADKIVDPMGLVIGE